MEIPTGSLDASWTVVKASVGLLSAICLEISPAVLRVFAVVTTAPRDMTERQTIGMYMEFGERMRTTSPLRIPTSWWRHSATRSTALQRSEKLKLWPVAASMKAVVPRCG